MPEWSYRPLHEHLRRAALHVLKLHGVTGVDNSSRRQNMIIIATRRRAADSRLLRRRHDFAFTI